MRRFYYPRVALHQQRPSFGRSALRCLLLVVLSVWLTGCGLLRPPPRFAITHTPVSDAELRQGGVAVLPTTASEGAGGREQLHAIAAEWVRQLRAYDRGLRVTAVDRGSSDGLVDAVVDHYAATRSASAKRVPELGDALAVRYLLATHVESLSYETSEEVEEQPGGRPPLETLRHTASLELRAALIDTVAARVIWEAIDSSTDATSAEVPSERTLIGTYRRPHDASHPMPPDVSCLTSEIARTMLSTWPPS